MDRTGQDGDGEEARVSGENERSCGDESADHRGERARGCVQKIKSAFPLCGVNLKT